MRITTFILLAFVLLHVVSCKDKNDHLLDAFAGKYIQKIEKYNIIAEDGSSYQLDDDHIAKMYYLIRHAEKDTTVKNDPPLSFNGELRGTKLAQILWNTKIDAIYSTITTRTLFTVDSLADTRAMSPIPYDNKEIKNLIDGIRKDKEKNRVLIVGHSNTIPVIANHIVGYDYFKKTIDENDYDNFIIVMEKTDSTKTILPLKYKFY